MRGIEGIEVASAGPALKVTLGIRDTAPELASAPLPIGYHARFLHPNFAFGNNWLCQENGFGLRAPGGCRNYILMFE
jgi:hypothetical protein